MKKTNKSNPLKTFNDNKAMAYKKAGGEMAAYKKSLPKAKMGMDMGRRKRKPNEPMQPEAKMETLKASNVKPTGYRETELQDSRPKSGPLPERATKGLDYYFSIPSAPEVMAVRDQKERNMRQSPEFQTENNMRADYYRKGGSVKRKKK